MKPRLPALVLSGVLIPATYANPQLGQICHPDPDYVKYNYAGLWEKDDAGNFICNYRQFIPESEAIAALREQEPEEYEEDDEWKEEDEDEPDYEDEECDGDECDF